MNNTPNRLYAFSIIVWLATLVSASLPESKPSDVSLSAFNNTKTIRGVNAGAQYIVEPWMVGDFWTDTLQCNGTDLERRSERGCIEESWNGDVDRASVAWKSHWDTWITHDDIQLMVSYGVNTIRIPVGFWMMEDIVSEYELFPKGMPQTLDGNNRSYLNHHIHIFATRQIQNHVS